MRKSHKQKFSNYRNLPIVRRVPFFIKIQMFFNNVVWFIGFFFFVIGGGALLVFGQFVDFSSFSYSEDDPIVTGVVTSRKNTSSTVNDNVVIKYDYYFYVNRKKIEGVGYTTIELPDTVEIQYQKNIPEKSRIVGTISAVMPFWVIFFFLIFPTIGGIMLFFSSRKVLNYIRIVQIGQVTFGIYVRREITGASVNEQNVYRFFFKFSYQGKEYEATGETHKVYKLTDEQFEPLVFNPNNPNEAVMIDGFPKSVRRFFAADIERAKVLYKNIL